MIDTTKQTRINFYTNILALIVNVVIGIYYTPYLVGSLGLAAYGILPLALIINQYIGVATQALTHSYTRFYGVALQRGDYNGASKVISTSLVVSILITILIVPVGIYIISKVDSLFQVPTGLLKSARLLFGFTILSFILSIVSSILNVTLYALNRLDLMNVLKIIRAVFKLVIVILLFEVVRIDVSFVGVANLLTECLILVASIYFFIRYKPSEVRISFALFDKVLLYSILGMSIWVSIQLCGDTLLYRTDNLIVNHYWGSESSGALGAVCEIGAYVSIIAGVIGSLFGPLIIASYAKNEHDTVKSLFIEQSTIVGCLSAILAGTIAGCSTPLLDVWLGQGMGQYNWWLMIKMLVIPFFAAGGIMAFVYRAWNKVRFPAICTLVLGIIDIAILVLVCEIINPSDVKPILIISTVFSFLQCFILNIICVYRIYNDCKGKFLSIFLKITISFIVCCVFGKIISTYFLVDNLFELGGMLVAVALLMFGFVFCIILNKDERTKLIEIVK